MQTNRSQNSDVSKKIKTINHLSIEQNIVKMYSMCMC
jgi:hypothetical protein